MKRGWIVLFVAILMSSSAQIVWGETFREVPGKEVCLENGRPIIRMYTQQGCSPCACIQETFRATVQDYVNQGKVVGHIWNIRDGDDEMTSAVERLPFPSAEQNVITEFGVVGTPTFIFGCRYYRIGLDAAEWSCSSQNLASEAAEFRRVMDIVIELSKPTPVCTDNDGDGYGTTGSSGCGHPEVDCDDSDANVHPGATERCNNRKDDNCNGLIDENCNPGDLNHDRMVNIFDLVLVASHYGKTGGFPPDADANGDGVVNIFDLVLVALNYGNTY